MYIEISARQSGKTTRLMFEVINYVSHNKKGAIIFAHNYVMANFLKKKISALTPRTDKIKCMPANLNSLAGLDLSKYRLFFDEFDFFDDENFWKYLATRTNLKNAYFCTTPKKIRSLKEIKKRNTNDVLVKILKKNGYNYISFPTRSDKKSYMNTVLNPTQYLTEMEGIFIN